MGLHFIHEYQNIQFLEHLGTERKQAQDGQLHLVDVDPPRLYE